MALTAGTAVNRRGAHRGNDYGYPVAAGEQVWRGGFLCLTAAGALVRPQTAGALVPAGLAATDYSNVGQASVSSQNIAALRGCWALTVPTATAANIGAPVYATDDNTFTLTAPTTGFTASIGTLNGIDNGQTYVLLAGS